MTDDKIDLYHHHKSTCSQKVRLCLAEKKIPWTGHLINIAEEENLSPEFLAINPNGVVPAIGHRGSYIIESSVIVEYLDEVFNDEPSLTPKDPIDRANMRAWLRFIDEVPSMAVRVPSYQLVLKKRFDPMSDEDYEDFVQKNPVRNEFFKRMGRNGFDDDEYNLAIARLTGTIKRMQMELDEHKWICGDRFGLADICLAPIFQRLNDLSLADMWDNFTGVKAWFDGVQERPSFDEAYYPGAKFMDQDI